MKFFKNFLALSFGIIVSLVLLEVFLRIYNPFLVQIKRNKLVLPVNHKYTFSNNYIDGLDTHIVHTRNSLGFRGEEVPQNLKNKISIITIGGSTTACLYLSDGDDWPNVLANLMKGKIADLWLNNAGFDGHSTLGHQVLLEEYVAKISPKYVLFLVGINDMEIDEDLFLKYRVNEEKYSKKNWKVIAIENSELASTIHNLYLVYLSREKSVTHFNLDLNFTDSLILSRQEIEKEKLKQIPYLNQYKKRIEKLINICNNNKITPVFITQPILAGKGTDPKTRVNLEHIIINNKRNGLAQWEILEMYNEVTKKTCEENNLLCIDLANKLPKSRECFYDGLHFTKAGSEKVAEIVEKYLTPYIIEKENIKL